MVGGWSAPRKIHLRRRASTYISQHVTATELSCIWGLAVPCTFRSTALAGYRRMITLFSYEWEHQQPHLWPRLDLINVTLSLAPRLIRFNPTGLAYPYRCMHHRLSSAMIRQFFFWCRSYTEMLRQLLKLLVDTRLMCIISSIVLDACPNSDNCTVLGHDPWSIYRTVGNSVECTPSIN